MKKLVILSLIATIFGSAQALTEDTQLQQVEDQTQRIDDHNNQGIDINYDENTQSIDMNYDENTQSIDMNYDENTQSISPVVSDQYHQERQRAKRRLTDIIFQLLHNTIAQPAHHMNDFDWKFFNNYVSTFSDSAFIDFQDEDGNTALHLALINANFKAAKALLEAGADPTISNNDGLTVLDVARAVQRIRMYDNVNPGFMNPARKVVEEFEQEIALIITEVSSRINNKLKGIADNFKADINDWMIPGLVEE